MSDINRGDAFRNPLWSFLFRSLLIGAVLGLPGALFFSPIEKVLRFLMRLQAVQIAGDLVQLAIVFTLLGLILQGLFHLVRSGVRLSKPKQ